MSGRARHRHSDRYEALLSDLNRIEAMLADEHRKAAGFVEHKSGINQVRMMLDKITCAKFGACFLVGHRCQDQVSLRKGARTLERRH